MSSEEEEEEEISDMEEVSLFSVDTSSRLVPKYFLSLFKREVISK